MNSEEIAKYLPEEVNEYFGISENVSQWEDENTEEIDWYIHEGVVKIQHSCIFLQAVL